MELEAKGGMSIKDIWDRNGAEYDSNAYSTKVIQHRFMSQQTTEVITAEKSLLLKDKSHLDVADEIARITGGLVTGENDKNYVITGMVDTHPTLVFVSQGSHSRNAPPSLDNENENEEKQIIGMKINRVKVEICSHRNAIKSIVSHLVSAFKEAKISSVRWWYKSDHGTNETKEMFLEPAKTILYPEYYPEVGDPIDYLRNYLTSEASVLLLSGPAGVGKTTLLRHMISDFDLCADVIYDESLMTNDSVFQNFLFSKSQVMIIEDADSILLPRTGHNTFMARFLSVSDGIIKFPDKKLVFTTNLSDFTKVDQALIRPGRCYDRRYFRKLNYAEACAAAKVAKIKLPTFEKSYTLAELFNEKSDAEPPKLGF